MLSLQATEHGTQCCHHDVVLQATFFWPWQHFFVHFDAIICCNMLNKTMRANVLDRSPFILYNYGVFSRITHVFLYLPWPVSWATFLHHFNATQCTSTFAGQAIMQKSQIQLVSFTNLYPCVEILLTKQKARKMDIFMVRYLTGLIGHVVVAPATYWSGESIPHSTCWAHRVTHTRLCGIGYITVWYRIRYCVILDTLLCRIGSVAWPFLYIFLAAEWKTKFANDESRALISIRFKFLSLAKCVQNIEFVLCCRAIDQARKNQQSTRTRTLNTRRIRKNVPTSRPIIPMWSIQLALLYSELHEDKTLRACHSMEDTRRVVIGYGFASKPTDNILHVLHSL